MQPFVLNRHGRMVFPSNFLPELDFSVIDSQDQLEQVIRRDFETKAPSGTEILRRIEAGDHYRTRFELMRDMALNLFWTNRFAMTMYDKQPTRWRDVPQDRDDVFLPVLAPWQDGERKVDAVEAGFAALPAAWDAAGRGRDLRGALRRVPAPPPPRHRAAGHQAHGGRAARRARAGSPSSCSPTTPTTRCTGTSRSSTPEDVPELEALHRWAMVLHNQYPWDRAQIRLTQVGELTRRRLRRPVPPAQPRGARFIRRMARTRPEPPRRRGLGDGGDRVETRPPVRPYPPVACASSSGAAPARGAGGGQGRAPVHQRGPDPQHRLQLVADDGRRRSARRPGSSSGSTPARPLEDIALEAARAALRARGPRTRGDRGGPLLLLHQHPADAVGGHLAVRPAGHGPDARLVRHRRRLRRAALRPGRGDPAAAGGRAARPGGLRREVLRQDRQRPAVADDLRGRGRGDRRRRRPGRASRPTSRCSRPTPAAR